MSDETEWVLVKRDDLLRWAEDFARDNDPGDDTDVVAPFDDYLLRPPAEAQAVARQYQDRNGKWHEFTDESHRLNTIEDGSWPIRALYAHPPPSAPVGVEGFEQWYARVDARFWNNWDACNAAYHAGKRSALAQQPAAVDGGVSYPTPRNRQEAAALAGLALAYLGVTRAHIDAVIARCETDLAAQQGGRSDD